MSCKDVFVPSAALLRSSSHSGGGQIEVISSAKLIATVHFELSGFTSCQRSALSRCLSNGQQFECICQSSPS